MNDKRLLELSAKAYGLVQNDKPFYASGLTERVKSAAGYGIRGWNPLLSDGDALRLAVKLGIDTIQHNNISEGTPECVAFCGNVCATVAYHDDPYSATRRAITIAAASIAEINVYAGA